MAAKCEGMLTSQLADDGHVRLTTSITYHLGPDRKIWRWQDLLHFKARVGHHTT
jgi:hypothetical protein